MFTQTGNSTRPASTCALISGCRSIWRRASTPYVNGLIWAIIPIHPGTLVNGKKAPDRKNIGNTSTCIMIPNPSVEFISEAISNPIPEMANARRIIRAIIPGTANGCMAIFTSGLRTSSRMPCSEAMEVAPRILPVTMAIRETGATRISFRKPNSRSQTVETVEKKATLITLIATIPGNINFT